MVEPVITNVCWDVLQGNLVEQIASSSQNKTQNVEAAGFLQLTDIYLANYMAFHCKKKNNHCKVQLRDEDIIFRAPCTGIFLYKSLKQL